MSTKEEPYIIPMTNQEIFKGNKLIAKLVGMQPGKPNETRWASDWFDVDGFIDGARHEKLRFHDSWDWLMPVVHNCIKYCHDNMLEEWEQSFSDKFMTCDIMVLFNEVVKFIKWYNTQK